MSTTCRRPARARRASPTPRTPAAPYAYFDPSRPARLWPPFGSAGAEPVDWTNPPQLDPAPMQVVRRYPIHAETMAMNRAYWALPGIKGTVWEHYMLVADAMADQRRTRRPRRTTARSFPAEGRDRRRGRL